MLYVVRRGDTLSGIAARFRTSVNAILNANLICNPNLIYPGQVLIIPQPGLNLPKAGAGPYYVIQPGDTLYCIARQLGTTIQNLLQINRIQNPGLIYPGTELLVITPTTDDPEQLKLSWERAPGEDCNVFGFTEYGVYYLGSFEWAAFGPRAVGYLAQLLNHRCEIVRMYAVISLGRLGINNQVTNLLRGVVNDPAIGDLARLAIRRIELVQRGARRAHITINDTVLLNEPRLNSTSTALPKGSEIVVQRWFIPSPTGEEGPRGGIQIYDLVQVLGTGQIGFIPRAGYGQISFI
ncbi:MAG: LysM peptidoglycan-binding domain-containing protein [Bacillota bacterium]